jgi:hypothetical protein
LRILNLAALAAAFVAAMTSLASAEPPFIGNWHIASAVVAPWADSQQRKPDEKERARLIGKTITISISAKAIAGPLPFPCKGAHYAIKDYTADLLFQGAFEEMRSKDKSVDPNKLAASLGFKGTNFKTLKTGCEFDFHFVDERTAEVSLNDYIYTLKKQ